MSISTTSGRVRRTFAAAFAIPLSLPLVVSAVIGLAFAPLAWVGLVAIRRAAVTA
jgi:hypothetical protein